MEKKIDNSALNTRRNFIKKAFFFLTALGIFHIDCVKLGNRVIISDSQLNAEILDDKLKSEEGKQKYEIEIEIYEANGFCYPYNHRKGDNFKYPKDWEKICPSLRGSMIRHIQKLESGENFWWTYSGTPYEKVINKDGITTEYVRCPDPTANNVVAKIIRKEIF
jgi:uncharacterized repeat protein (TIGR04076 family)